MAIPKIPNVKIHVLPGGAMPERQSDGAIGYDVRIRAVVSPYEMNPVRPELRKTLFNFMDTPDDPNIAEKVSDVTREDGQGNELVYRLEPNESVLVGIGFITQMPFPMFYWIVPRSGLASKWGITVTNAPGTIDPDYRGEAGVIVSNRSHTMFYLRHGMRIAQIIFQYAIIPRILKVSQYENLLSTKRGAGGFGSTGLS